MRNLVNKPTDTDGYLAQLPPDQRMALRKLRDQIKAAAPDTEEYFGYGLPGFRYKGKALLYMGAARNHCALYGMIPAGFAEKLKGYTMSKGTIQFSPEKPIPAAVVKAIVKQKVAEIDAKSSTKVKKSAPRKATRKK